MRDITSAEARAIAREAYIYAYPIVLMDATMRQVTAVPTATAVAGRAPINQFAHFRSYPAADARDVVRFNFDTLYSFAWLDLAQEPIILTTPDTGGRYYLVPTLDMWTDVFCSLGSRTTGVEAGNFAYTAPGWRGDLPAGVTRIEAPTSTIWMMGRIQTDGPADYANVHAVQDGLTLTPLSAWGHAYAPPSASPVDATVDTETPPLVQVDRLTGVEFFARLAALMQQHPPHGIDYPILFRLKMLGLKPDTPWDPSTLDQATLAAINAGAAAGREDMAARLRTAGMHVNGWNIGIENIGAYGASYLQRAMIALGGLGANLPEDAVYPTAFFDAEGQPLDGANRYVLHFEAGKLPPAEAFWSLTMYDGEGFQVPNHLNRFAIGDRDSLAYAGDGSLDIYIQSDSPGGEQESNWLPAPKSGPMGPTMRVYSPRREVLDGSWTPPPLLRQTS